jgi:hypothetical protein
MLGAGLNGCSLDAVVGNSMAGFAVGHIAPYTMGTADLQMACHNGQGTGNMLLAYSRVMDMPHKAGATAMLSSAMCSEFVAYEAELDHVRLLHLGDVAGAKDARIRQQRVNTLTSQRYWRAYQHVVAAFGEPGTTCPDLEEGEDILYATGLSAGAQAFLNDRLGGGENGIPLAVMSQVSNGLDCLDSDSLWGMPHAIQSALWAGLPGGGPEGRDGPGQLAAAIAVGDKTGQRMSRAIAMQSWVASGDVQAVRQALRDHRASLEAVPSAPDAVLLDVFSTALVTHQSDLLWMEAVGHRTPTGGLGTFWDDSVVEDEEDDDLLGDIDVEGEE